jgi:hypothetical protein
VVNPRSIGGTLLGRSVMDDISADTALSNLDSEPEPDGNG